MKTYQNIALGFIAALAIAQPVLADNQGLSRAQVREQLVQAQQRGTEVNGDMVNYKAATTGRALSRAEVAHDLADAKAHGTTLVGDTVFNQADNGLELGKTRAQVKQELVAAESCGFDVVGDTTFPRDASHCAQGGTTKAGR